MEKMILNEFLGQSGDLGVTIHNLYALLGHIEKVPSAEAHLANATLINVYGALASLEALVTAME